MYIVFNASLEFLYLVNSRDLNFLHVKVFVLGFKKELKVFNWHDHINLLVFDHFLIIFK